MALFIKLQSDSLKVNVMHICYTFAQEPAKKKNQILSLLLYTHMNLY